MAAPSKPTATAAWARLQAAADQMRRDGTTLNALFQADPKRFERLHATFEGREGPVLLDYSKNRVTDAVLADLLELAREMQVEEHRRRMFAGDKINITENRAVLHVALRNRSNTPILVDGGDVMPDVNRVLAQMEDFATRVRTGVWKGGLQRECIGRWLCVIGGSHAAARRPGAAGRRQATRARPSRTWSTSASAARTSAR